MDILKVLEPIAGEMAAMESRLGAVCASIASADGTRPAPLRILEQIARHPFAVPGKRLRPALVLLAYRAARGRAPEAPSAEEAAVGLATAVEILHAASLVHDDIIDGAIERRHQVSLNQRLGDRVAVLAGDILYTEFFTLVAELPLAPELHSRLLSLFLGTTRKMCVGEILAQEAAAPREAGAAAGGALGFDEYLEIAADKTASLFAACCEGGALVGGCGKEEARALGEFGRLFGLTFQMLDDLADGDHGLDPAIDLRAATAEYARRTREAAAELGPASAGVAELLAVVVAESLCP
jgi:geranylgeranyl pyrophosphate synthase